jgi:subtilisin family serine protease
MNISGAWRLGFTGKNVVVTILDDGIEKDHPDLIQNYVSISLRCDVYCMFAC